MNITDYINRIYRLRFINRYNNRIRVRDEDVAQHSFFVSSIILKLYDEYEFDLGIALQAAVSHDITEADLSDITHDVKENNPSLAAEVKKAEYREIEKYPKAVIDGFKIFDECDSVEGLIANLADIIQVQQYINSEIALGNSTVWDIDFDAQIRRSHLIEELKRYVRD